VVALARQPPPAPDAANASHAPGRSPRRYLWAVLLARNYEILVPALRASRISLHRNCVLPLRCALCGADMRLVAFVTDPPANPIPQLEPCGDT
jgi:hypothetical protein